MDINDLTIGQVRELSALIQSGGGKSEICGWHIGKYAIVRSRNEGINAGVVIAADGTGIVLGEARRIWYHRPADNGQSWYEGVANTGLRSDSKISAPVSEKIIVENYSITVCTADAEKSIREFPSHAQS